MWLADWTMGLLGGLLIGAAGTLFLVVNGRIMGASGILGGLIDGTGKSNFAERMAFVGALVLAPAAAAALFGVPATHATHNVPILILAGLLVGIGTRIGSGCTSGHGVCGMSRLSTRSILATAIYLASGAATVLLAKHALGIIQ